MTVWQLIEKLKQMPITATVKIDNDEYLLDIDNVRHEHDRDYVIIKNK